MRTIAEINLDGGVLCFNFINTMHDRVEQGAQDYLGSYTDLVQWCRRLGLYNDTVSEHLQGTWAGQPEKAQAALKRIIAVRENLYLLFSDIAAGREPGAQTLVEFNAGLSEALACIKLKFDHTDYHLVTDIDEKSLTAPLAHILRSAFDVLADEPRDRIKECANCGWIFLDQTKNNTRQWCNPNTCGTIVRSRRYQERKKASSAEK